MKGFGIGFRGPKPSEMLVSATTGRSRTAAKLLREHKTWNYCLCLPAAMLLAVMVTGASGQSASLYEKVSGQRPLSARDVSFHWRMVEPAKEFQLHDIVTVLVDEKSSVISDGEMDRRKKANGMLSLTDWIVFDGLAIRPDPQTPGDPKVAGKVENKYRAEGNLETLETMKFTIACTVVDKRPNGHLVIEGHRSIQNNNEQWDVSYSGVVRPEDVLPNNTVLSEDVLFARIVKNEAGHVRDGYRRGWLLRWLDKYQPF